MPLVKCAECQQPVSRTAATCPNCGASVKYKPSFSFVLVVLIVIGLVVAGVISLVNQNQKTQHAKAELEDSMRGGDRLIAAYKQIYSTPKPSDASKRERDHAPAAPPPPPPQAQRYTTAVLKRPTTFQLPSGNVTLPRGSQVEFVSREGPEVRVRYRNHQQSVPASDVDLR